MYTSLIKSINRMLLKMYSITKDKFSVIIIYCLQRFLKILILTKKNILNV